MASSIPGPARDIVRAVTQALDTAVSGDDVATYDRATAQLATQPTGGRVLGDVLRSLLEDTHPDGFSSDDITLVVGRCYRAAVAWLPPERVDVTMLLAALAGALGIHEPGITYEALDLPRSNADECRDPDDTVPVKPPAWPTTRGMRRCWWPICCRSLPQRWVATWRAHSPSTRGRPAKNCPDTPGATRSGGNRSVPRAQARICRDASATAVIVVGRDVLVLPRRGPPGVIRWAACPGCLGIRR